MVQPARNSAPHPLSVGSGSGLSRLRRVPAADHPGHHRYEVELTDQRLHHGHGSSHLRGRRYVSKADCGKGDGAEIQQIRGCREFAGAVEIVRNERAQQFMQAGKNSENIR